MDECFQGKAVQYQLKYGYPEVGERDLLLSYFPIEGPSGIDRIACDLAGHHRGQASPAGIAAQ